MAGRKSGHLHFTNTPVARDLSGEAKKDGQRAIEAQNVFIQ